MPGTWNSPQTSNDSLIREAEAMVLSFFVVGTVKFREYGVTMLGVPLRKVFLANAGRMGSFEQQVSREAWNTNDINSVQLTYMLGEILRLGLLYIELRYFMRS